MLPVIVGAQKKYTISGYIVEKGTGEQLIGATVFETGTQTGTVSNTYGFFSLTEEKKSLNLEFSFIGFKRYRTKFELISDTFLIIELVKGVEIKEVQVLARGLNYSNPEISELSQPHISMHTIESVPMILGENDILKTLQFMPGIKQGAENTAGFNVRGGSADQNLILLDGVPVYNVNHLLGFFSVFNTDAIKNVTLIKGGIPARYGGRLSSVLDISMKEGNLKKNSGIFSISPIAGRFTFEAPIKKDTAAFIISFRRTLFDIPMVAAEKLMGENGSYGYYFYDFNAKANWIFNQGSRLYLSIYTGKDNQFSKTKNDGKSKSSYTYNWGNITSVLRWNKVFSSKLFSNTSVYYSHFNHSEEGKVKDENNKSIFKTNSELNDFCFKTDFDFFVAPVYSLRFGMNLSHLIFNPNIIQLKSSDSNIVFNEENKNQANQTDLYVENSFNFYRLKLNIGGRFSGYFANSRNYMTINPRVSAGLLLFPSFSMSASYSEMNQNIHLLTNSSLGMPTDLWVASTDKVGPQKSKQASFGFSKRFTKSISFEIEGYYKTMENVVRFDEGVAFLNPNESNWDENVLIGNGRAYGVEFMVRKKTGNFTGLLSYTLSKSERKYNGLNYGNWFPFKYDRRHDVSFLAEYKFKKTYNRTRSISIGFTLQSGNNLSIPDIEYKGLLTPGRDIGDYYDSWEVIRQTYDSPNNFKMPAFHHLDLGYNIVKEKSDGKTVTWSFSIYNVYNRFNPWYYYKSGSVIKQVSLFPIVPSVAFKYTF